MYYSRYQQAYYDIYLFFREHNFVHRQGSGYVSIYTLTTADIIDVIGDFNKSFSWSEYCVKKIDVTNIGVQYDLKELLFSNNDNSFNIQ